MLSPNRFIGLDIHKAYFVAVGVDAKKQVVFGPQTVPNHQLDVWAEKFLLPTDAVVVEMTVNTYLFHDVIAPHVHSIIAVHPPNVTLVTGVKVKTDKKAALTFAQLYAVGMLEGVWIPPEPVRCLRASDRPTRENGAPLHPGQEPALFPSPAPPSGLFWQGKSISLRIKGIGGWPFRSPIWKT